jgi:hypothetical protein
MQPETRYAHSGSVNIAFQVVGDGPRDLVYVPGWVSNIEVYWEEPPPRRPQASAIVVGTISSTATMAWVRLELTHYRGREINTTGDGFFAAFDGPARAIRCARAVSDAVQSLGLNIRAGLHTGECEIIGEEIGGIVVHIGARIAALAAPGEVLVSSTVKDLVAGSGLSFRDRGTECLKGVPGEWHLYSAVP